MVILLYLLDSLRRDFVGCYGDAGALTPQLDRFAAGATRFTQAYAAAPWSKASGAALLTGFLPRSVGMRDLLSVLPAGVPTVAERLRAVGFRTVAATANPFIAHDFGLLRGFDGTIEAFRPGTLPGEPFRFHANHFRRLAPALSVEPEALVLPRSPALHHALLEALPASGPAFALCWSMDTHAPFFVRGERSLFGNPLDRLIPAADPEWLTDGLAAGDMVRLYRDMVAFNDASFGELVASLQTRGQWDEALVIVAGDHGEAFGEHGLMGHTNGLWEEQIGVPLLAKFPGQRAGVVCDTPVLLTDIAPTIERLLGLPPAEGDGMALQRTLAGEGAGRALLLENPTGWAVRAGPWKAIAARDDAPPLVFNLDTDPAERRPLPDEGLRRELAQQATSLRAAADAQAAQWESSAPNEDERVRDRLRALGYL